MIFGFFFDKNKQADEIEKPGFGGPLPEEALSPPKSGPVISIRKLEWLGLHFSSSLLLHLVNGLQFLVSFNDRWLVELLTGPQFFDELRLLKFTLVALQCLIDGFAIFYINNQHDLKVMVAGRKIED